MNSITRFLDKMYEPFVFLYAIGYLIITTPEPP